MHHELLLLVVASSSCTQTTELITYGVCINKCIIMITVPFVGVFNLRPLLRTSINIPALQLRPDTVARWSPLAETNLAAVARVPALVVVGEHDSPAFRQQAEQYRDQLSARGVPVTFTTQGGEDHFSLVEKLKDDDYALSKQIIEFMNKY